jgi:hypothetical protein
MPSKNSETRPGGLRAIGTGPDTAPPTGTTPDMTPVPNRQTTTERMGSVGTPKRTLDSTTTPQIPWEDFIANLATNEDSTDSATQEILTKYRQVGTSPTSQTETLTPDTFFEKYRGTKAYIKKIFEQAVADDTPPSDDPIIAVMFEEWKKGTYDNISLTSEALLDIYQQIQDFPQTVPEDEMPEEIKTTPVEEREKEREQTFKELHILAIVSHRESDFNAPDHKTQMSTRKELLSILKQMHAELTRLIPEETQRKRIKKHPFDWINILHTTEPEEQKKHFLQAIAEREESNEKGPDTRRVYISDLARGISERFPDTAEIPAHDRDTLPKKRGTVAVADLQAQILETFPGVDKIPASERDTIILKKKKGRGFFSTLISTIKNTIQKRIFAVAVLIGASSGPTHDATIDTIPTYSSSPNPDSDRYTTPHDAIEHTLDTAIDTNQTADALLQQMTSQLHSTTSDEIAQNILRQTEQLIHEYADKIHTEQYESAIRIKQTIINIVDTELNRTSLEAIPETTPEPTPETVLDNTSNNPNEEVTKPISQPIQNPVRLRIGNAPGEQNSVWGTIDRLEDMDIHRPDGTPVWNNHEEFNTWRTRELHRLGYEQRDGRWGHPFTVHDGAQVLLSFDTSGTPHIELLDPTKNENQTVVRNSKLLFTPTGIPVENSNLTEKNTNPTEKQIESQKNESTNYTNVYINGTKIRTGDAIQIVSKSGKQIQYTITQITSANGPKRLILRSLDGKINTFKDIKTLEKNPLSFSLITQTKR